MNPDTLKFIEASIKTIPDYPKPGILFRDITSLIENAEAFKATIDLLAEHYRDQGITKIVGTEARGFIFGAPVAFAMGLGFVPVRKPGKLPRAIIEESYALEYGTDTLQLHTDAIVPGDKVLVVDDLLATGGTVDATVKLIRRAGGEVADAAFIISLPSLGGDARLTAAGVKVVSLVELAGESAPLAGGPRQPANAPNRCLNGHRFENQAIPPTAADSPYSPPSICVSILPQCLVFQHRDL